MSHSEFVCRRCGLAVYSCPGGTWKHAAGRNQKSCGTAPIVESRAVYQKRMDDLVQAAKLALNRKPS
jgi:hypothetical protein